MTVVNPTFLQRRDAASVLQEVVKFAVLTALATHTLSADGNTLTKSTAGALTLDSVTPAVGDVFLYVPNPGSAESGYYKVVTVGDGGVAWVVTRIDGWLAGYVPPVTMFQVRVLAGAVQAGRTLLVTAASVGAAITLGTTLLQTFVGDALAPSASYTDTSGTPGAATAHTGSGRSAIALGATSAVITNNQCVAACVVLGTLEDRDATGVDLCIVPGAGSFTASVAAAATAATKFRWTVFRPASAVA